MNNLKTKHMKKLFFLSIAFLLLTIAIAGVMEERTVLALSFFSMSFCSGVLSLITNKTK